MRTRLLLFAVTVVAAFLWWAWQETPPRGEMPPLPMPSRHAALIVAGARAQIGDVYDSRYQDISYPGGDVKKGRGACTDVVVRALRRAGLDLQETMHRDMSAHFSIYPHSWGLTAPNADIDHRRVPNQIAFLGRHARSLTTSVSGRALAQWQPGDIVYWNTAGALRQTLHTGIVSNRRSARGVPFVIHNGWRCVEEDALRRWPVIAHFRTEAKPAS